MAEKLSSQSRLTESSLTWSLLVLARNQTLPRGRSMEEKALLNSRCTSKGLPVIRCEANSSPR